jgi:hypothetical protein
VSGRANNGLVWWLSGLAFLQSLSAASILSDIFTPKISGFFAAVVAALSAATATYVAGKRPLVDAQPSPPGVAR